ncbi:MAG: hypothetical protein WC975_00655 [Phycisphaerae bacterium]
MNESTKIEFRYRRISQLSDVSDLAEMLFPGNRNQQHAFQVIWVTLKWAKEKVISDLADVAERNAVSRRTLERTRAKMKRLGIIERVSRFSSRNNYQDGWVLSGRFENGLRQLAGKIENLKNTDMGSREKDELLIQLADAQRVAVKQKHGGNEDEWNEG